MQKPLKIDFLYLDLHTCDRCMATDETLNEALKELGSVLRTIGYEPEINKVNIIKRELAEQYHFLSSPTIRVNGVDICGNITENNCDCCGDLCGDSIDCRTFTYDGQVYDQPPKAMLVDGILRALYGQLPQPPKTYVLPKNLDRFFTGLETKECGCSGGCC